MLATLGEVPHNEAGWQYEFKWDGVRALAFVEGGSVRYVSRNGNDLTASVPELASLADHLDGATTAVLDGELIALDDRGRPSFQLLQQRHHEPVPVSYVAFDLLYLNGRMTTDLPYAERRLILEDLVAEDGRFRVSPRFDGPGADLLAISRAQGLEGIVAKRMSSPYRTGKRSAEWLKLKNVRTQEVVVGGWTSGQGTRASRIGSLLLGVPDESGLRYVGQVGTGFSEATLLELAGRLGPLARDSSPFSNPVPRQYAKGAHYVDPVLVGEVAFAEWTTDGRLRHPAWRGLREDKAPAEVRRES